MATARGLPDHPAELVRLRESLRREAAGVTAVAAPLGKFLHGRREFAASGVLPGQARLGVEHGDVGKTTVLVFLQARTAATRHLLHLVEREKQHLAVLANDRDGVAEHLGDRARLVRHVDIEDLLALLGGADAVVFVDDEALALVARDQEFASALVDEQRDRRGLRLEIDELADRLAMTAAARKFCDIERVEFSVGGEQQQLRGRFREEREPKLVVLLESQPREILDMALEGGIQPLSETTTVTGSRSTRASSI